MHKSKHGPEFKQRKLNYTHDTHWRPSMHITPHHRSPIQVPKPSGIEPGQMGLPKNNNKSKAEYTNTQQDLPDKQNIQLDMQGFLAAGFVLPKATKS
jgi:hypothetical protein